MRSSSLSWVFLRNEAPPPSVRNCMTATAVRGQVRITEHMCMMVLVLVICFVVFASNSTSYRGHLTDHHESTGTVPGADSWLAEIWPPFAPVPASTFASLFAPYKG